MKRIFFSLALLFCGILTLSGQDKTYRFLDLQITYPSSYCIIYDYEEESDIIDGNTCSFIVSAIFSNNTEERMKVEVTEITSPSFKMLQALEMTREDILSYCLGATYESLKSAPVYSQFKQTYSVTEATYGCIDFTGRFFRAKRTGDNAYYENFKGRIYAFYFGDYYVQFTMQVPTTNNFNTLMTIAKSMKSSRKAIYG